MPLVARKKLLLAKLETAYGTDSVPTGAANATLARKIRLEPMLGEDVSRELDQPYMGAQPTIPAGLHAKLVFEVELEPSGTAGTAPAWGVLLRGCAMAQTVAAGVSVTYNPVTDGHEALSIYMSLDGVRYVLLGARGSVKWMISAQQIPVMEFTFTGLWQPATDATLSAPTYSAFKTPIVANKTNTPVFTVAGASNLTMKDFTLDLGNDVQNRFLIGAAADQVIIVDRAPALEMTIEAEPMSVFNPYTLARDQTTVAVVLQHGVAAGRRATLNLPRLQIQRPDSPTEEQGRVMWPIKGVPLPNTGNDEMTLVLT